MPALLTTAAASEDLFSAWLDRSPARTRVRGRHPADAASGPRFALYGRISTDGYQDPASSRQWQYDQAVRLTAGPGDVHPDPRSRPASRPPATVWLPSGRCRTAPEPDPRPMGPTPASP